MGFAPAEPFDSVRLCCAFEHPLVSEDSPGRVLSGKALVQCQKAGRSYHAQSSPICRMLGVTRFCPRKHGSSMIRDKAEGKQRATNHQASELAKAVCSKSQRPMKLLLTMPSKATIRSSSVDMEHGFEMLLNRVWRGVSTVLPGHTLPEPRPPAPCRRPPRWRPRPHRHPGPNWGFQIGYFSRLLQAWSFLKEHHAVRHVP